MTAPIHIVLVEDDQRLRELVQQYLLKNGFTVTAMADGRQLLSTVQQSQPALVILDIMLPGADGFELCRQIRRFYAGPLLFMTAKNEANDQVLGFELGADDYVIKPVEPRILVARINALLRRSYSHSHEQQEDLVFGSLSINKRARRVDLNGSDITLTSHEFDLLYILAQNAGQVVERDAIYRNLIGREYDGLDRSADVRISR
ncbi:MAG: response regulator transcription factor, partial [Alteromonas sp.]